MTSYELQSLAAGSHLLRASGLTDVADRLDADISACLVGKFLEDELDRNLARHRELLRDEHGDPFGDLP